MDAEGRIIRTGHRLRISVPFTGRQKPPRLSATLQGRIRRRRGEALFEVKRPRRRQPGAPPQRRAGQSGGYERPDEHSQRAAMNERAQWSATRGSIPLLHAIPTMDLLRDARRLKPPSTASPPSFPHATSE